MICKQCGEENDSDASICSRCGMKFDKNVSPSQTRSLRDLEKEHEAKYGVVRFSTGKQLILTIGDVQDKVVFEAGTIDNIVLGRVDLTTGDKPGVDLSPFNAQELGVSRRHATIIHQAHTLFLIDMNSSNGTYLNGQRITANQPRVLRDGDKIHLGNLLVRISYNG